jgi:hypothetical protein
MRFRKELAEPWFFLRRPVERGHELLPLQFIDHEPRLIGERLLCLLTGGAQNEVGDIYSLARCRNLDECLLARGGPQLDSEKIPSSGGGPLPTWQN